MKKVSFILWKKLNDFLADTLVTNAASPAVSFPKTEIHCIFNTPAALLSTGVLYKAINRVLLLCICPPFSEAKGEPAQGSHRPAAALPPALCALSVHGPSCWHPHFTAYSRGLGVHSFHRRLLSTYCAGLGKTDWRMQDEGNGT